LKILICLNKDSMSLYALNLLLPYLLENGHRLEIFISHGVGDPKKAIADLKEFEVKLFDEHFPFLNAAGSPKENCFYTFEQIAESLGVKISSPKNINNPDTIEYITQSDFNLAISIRFGHIFKDNVISAFNKQKGILNLHSGPLPDYKGILATFQALRQGDTDKIGSTLHYITDKDIDVGPVISISKILFDQEKSLVGHVMDIYDAAIPMIIDAVSKLAKGEKPEASPQQQGGEYFSMPTHEQIEEFRLRGLEFYNNEDLNRIKSKF